MAQMRQTQMVSVVRIPDEQLTLDSIPSSIAVPIGGPVAASYVENTLERYNAPARRV